MKLRKMCNNILHRIVALLALPPAFLLLLKSFPRICFIQNTSSLETCKDAEGSKGGRQGGKGVA